MASFKAIIKDPVGMHARPAALTVGEANRYKSDIVIKADGKEGNLKSIMNVMALAIKTGTEFEVVANGPDEDQAVDGIKKAMKENDII